MSTKKISNITIDEIRRFLRHNKVNPSGETKGRGGHERWTRQDLKRPITIQSHVEPVPEFIVKQILRVLNLSKEDFHNWKHKVKDDAEKEAENDDGDSLEALNDKCIKGNITIHDYLQIILNPSSQIIKDNEVKSNIGIMVSSQYPELTKNIESTIAIITGMVNP